MHGLPVLCMIPLCLIPQVPSLFPTCPAQEAVDVARRAEHAVEDTLYAGTAKAIGEAGAAEEATGKVRAGLRSGWGRMGGSGIP